jgi:hypothetical protein
MLEQHLTHCFSGFDTQAVSAHLLMCQQQLHVTRRIREHQTTTLDILLA